MEIDYITSKLGITTQELHTYKAQRENKRLKNRAKRRRQGRGGWN